MNPSAELHRDFEELFEREDFASVEELWMALIEKEDPSELPDIESLLYAADRLLGASEKSRTQVLLDLTIPVYETNLSADHMLEILKRKCIASPHESEVRDRFVEAFAQHHGTTSVPVAFMKIVEFEQNPDSEKAIRQLDHWLRFRAHSFVYHGAGWGTGQIQSVDGIVEQAVVNFEKKPDHRMSLEALGSVLEPLADDHFLVLEYQGGDRIREMIEDDPVGIMDTILRSFRNPMALRHVKEHLSPRFIKTASWSKWWNKAKKQLRDNGHYTIENRSPFTIEKRKVAVSYEDEMLGQFRSSKWSERRNLVRTATKARTKHPRFIAEISEYLKGLAQEGRDSESVLAAAMLEKLGGETVVGEASPVHQALVRCEDPVQAICDMVEGDEQRRAMTELFTLVGDGWGEAAMKLWIAGSDVVRDELADRVDKDGLVEQAAAVLRNNLTVPRQGPGCFMWYVRKKISGATGGIFEPLDALALPRLFRKVIDLLDFLDVKGGREGRDCVRDVISKIRTLLSGRNYHFLKQALVDVPLEDGRTIYKRLLGLGGLSESQKTEMIDLVIRACPDVVQKVEVPIWEQDVIFVTPLGLQIRQEEFRQLREEKLPEVFKDVGRAAAFGDLRENAEYKAALEQRDQLTKKAEDIEEELKKVELITPDLLIEDEVTLGAKVTLERLDTGEEVSYRILGPWDADPDHGVLSYQSPLGRSLFGAAVGDEVEVELPSGVQSYRVRAVEAGIE
jgi:transcription elongation factor GreA